MQDNTNRLIAQIRPLLRDDESYGRLHADVHDLIEICTRFLRVTSAGPNRALTREELEGFLIDLDIEIDHSQFHLNSLKAEIGSALVKLADDAGDEKERRGVA